MHYSLNCTTKTLQKVFSVCEEDHEGRDANGTDMMFSIATAMDVGSSHDSPVTAHFAFQLYNFAQKQTHTQTIKHTGQNHTSRARKHTSTLNILSLKKPYGAENDLPTCREEVYYHDNRYVGLSSEEEASALWREIG